MASSPDIKEESTKEEEEEGTNKRKCSVKTLNMTIYCILGNPICRTDSIDSPLDKLFHAFRLEFDLFLPPDFPSDIPTFVSHNSRTNIDAVLTNEVSLVEPCVIQEQSVSSSPHNPIQFTLVCHFGKPVPSPESRNGPDHKPAKLLWPHTRPTRVIKKTEHKSKVKVKVNTKTTI